MIPQSEWRWFGVPGHFIGGPQCLFHLCTEVGDYVISTVGEYYPDTGKRWTPQTKPTEVGVGRLYETYIFRLGNERCDGSECGCDQRLIADYTEVAFRGANRRGDAQRNHLELCHEYAAKQ